MFSVFSVLTPMLSFFEPKTDISEEKLEEYKMLSQFKPKEIIRLRKVFLAVTDGKEEMTKELFVDMKGIALNPLKDRLCVCFGFNEHVNVLDFQAFLIGLSVFNSSGKREAKLKMAFKIQDFDGDGFISKQDLIEYLRRITGSTLGEEEIEEVAAEVFRETSSDPLLKVISFADFQRVVAPSDFQAKLMLPI
eukprot:CAMPEP_0173201390 /NCGR_PEP_ID=MMETSP1141-20130122/18325_1 /TAXON_ID=483371 /ORGANISM="non described non described, Strain CCMP2298" /LENGTH=191 /DNA_ID=CAMNT_0014126507 /DNA_START=60 /DNA_END=635 /DNA_ORIENTATION=+